MNICGPSILANPPAGGHIVYSYYDECDVVEAVSLYAAAGLSRGEAVVLIMTLPHCEAVESCLEAKGFDLDALKAEDRFICAAAARTLMAISDGEGPDAERFNKVIGEVIRRARGEGRQVRAFGEMVSLLRETDPRAALRLENFWNDLLGREAIALFCAYKLDDPDAELAADLCAAHSHRVA